MNRKFGELRTILWKGAFIIAAAMLLAGCSGGQSATQSGALPTPSLTETPWEAGGSPAEQPAAFPDLQRQASSLDIALKPAQNGSGYEESLASSKVAAEGDSALFSPAFASGTSALSDAAFAIYRLRCYQQADSAVLQLSWDSQPAQLSDCWIGVSDWSTLRWKWLPLPEAGQIALDPASFANEFHQGLVAVVLLGEQQAELARVEVQSDPDPTEKFTLFSPLGDTKTYLLNMDKEVVHTWTSAYAPGASVYLLDDMTLLRTALTNTNEFPGNGQGGGIERMDWEGNILWSVDLGSAGLSSHHDIELLPNGNILVIVWEGNDLEEAVQMGRNPANIGASGVWTDCVYEIRPIGSDDFEVVWEWHIKDHLIQDFDETKDNFGVVSEHPELLDFNYAGSQNPSWTHVNSVDYNADRDEIVISSHGPSEIFIIDHSTTTAEAASHSGGRHGRGGDFIFRWGNTPAYQIGFPSEQKLFKQHDANWIPEGYPGAGNIIIFNNREKTAEDANYSSVMEITPVYNPDDSYLVVANRFQPINPTWKFVADPPESMYSSFISGAQRLPDGNTLITEGDSGRILEVTAEMEIVWDFTFVAEDSSIPNIFRAYRYELFTPWLEFNEVAE